MHRAWSYDFIRVLIIMTCKLNIDKSLALMKRQLKSQQIEEITHNRTNNKPTYIPNHHENCKYQSFNNLQNSKFPLPRRFTPTTFIYPQKNRNIPLYDIYFTFYTKQRKKEESNIIISVFLYYVNTCVYMYMWRIHHLSTISGAHSRIGKKKKKEKKKADQHKR